MGGSESVFVRGFLKVNTPGAVVEQKGSLKITKSDDGGNPLSGVGFTLYDSSRRTISTKTTDSTGVVTFTGLTPGSYYYAETSALPGYTLDSTQYPVTITAGQTVNKSMTNSMSKGSLKIVKTDDQGNPLASTGFCLYDSSGTRIKSGSTDSSGILIFADLPLGDYFYQESFAIPGYALDDTMYPISVTEAGQVMLFNQAATDRAELSNLLHISDTQMGYVTDAEPGHGLLRVSGAVIPFDCSVPRDTELYRLMNTTPGRG